MVEFLFLQYADTVFSLSCVELSLAIINILITRFLQRSMRSILSMKCLTTLGLQTQLPREDLRTQMSHLRVSSKMFTCLASLILWCALIQAM